MRSALANPKNSLLLRGLRTAVLGVLLAALSYGCVYRINIQQGNSLDQKAVDQLAAGMTRSQVRYLLGTPLTSTMFDNDRWDYVYYLRKGHSRHVEERKLTVYFEGDKVARIERSDEPGKKNLAAAT